MNRLPSRTAGWLLLLLCFPLVLQAETFSSQLLRATAKISQANMAGTACVFTRPAADGSPQKQLILVTAGHVLEGMAADQATLHWRQKDAAGAYQKLPVQLNVRKDKKPLWVKHPTADVAALVITLPEAADAPCVPVDLLASDELLKQCEIQAGDSVLCLGFPHQFDNNQASFAVLRGGVISSGMLLPTKTTQHMLVSFNTFEGDSGGPVYLDESHRFVEGNPQPQPVRLILGIVQGQHFLDEDIRTPYEVRKVRHRLGLAMVLHATFLRETIAQLPQ